MSRWIGTSSSPRMCSRGSEFKILCDAYMYLAAGNKTSQMGPAMTATSQSLLTQENSDMTQVCTTMLSHDLILNWALQGR